MKPVDFRNETFRDIEGRIDADRARALSALRAGAACTTRELAERMGLAVEQVRPRVTELFQLGAVDLVGRQGHDGVYAARKTGEWMLWFDEQRRLHGAGEQTLLPI